MKKISVSLLGICLAISFSSLAFAAHGEKKAAKKGILLVSFGSSIPEARVAFENIEQKVRAAFPEVPVRWAYTSHIIRRKLAKEGTMLDSAEMALAKMMEEGFTHVAVQSLHTIGGEEFHGLRRNAHAFGQMFEGFRRIIVGHPLLGTEKDMVKVADALIANAPKERKKDEAVVLMGHGTHHPSNAFYAALMYRLQRKDPNFFVGTVEGSPEIGEIKSLLKAKKIRKAYLMPFMSVAGDHARNDMAGDEADSWKSILTKEGIACVSVLKGTAEYDNIVSVWTDHLKVAMAHLK